MSARMEPPPGDDTPREGVRFRRGAPRLTRAGSELRMPAMQSLETERLVLRPLTVEDAVDLHESFADPETMRYWHAPLHADEAATRAAVAEMLRPARASWWTLRLRGDERTAGFCGFHGGETTSGFGYLVRRDLAGRGLATEACRAALDHGFTRLGLESAGLWIHEENQASRRVAEKLGCRERARFLQRYPEGVRETHVFGVTARELRHEPRARDGFYGFVPVLAVADVAAAVAYYRDKLGFTVEFLVGDPPVHAGLHRGGFSPSGARLQVARASRGWIDIQVDGLDALCETYRSRGVRIVSEPETKPWGIRSFEVEDEGGTLLRFGMPAPCD